MAEATLAKKYEKIEFNGQKVEAWFKINDSHFVHVDLLSDNNFNCLVLEHAESMDQRYLAEDGDLLYPQDFDSENQLIEAMIKEITGE